MQALAAHAHVPLASWSPLLGLLTPAPPKSGVFALYRWNKTATATARSRNRGITIENGRWRGRRVAVRLFRRSLARRKRLELGGAHGA